MRSAGHGASPRYGSWSNQALGRIHRPAGGLHWPRTKLGVARQEYVDVLGQVVIQVAVPRRSPNCAIRLAASTTNGTAQTSVDSAG